MTLEEIEAMDKGCISSNVAASYLGCAPYAITLMARDCPERLPFPTFRSGNRTKIPRLAFIRWAKGEAVKDNDLDCDTKK